MAPHIMLWISILLLRAKLNNILYFSCDACEDMYKYGSSNKIKLKCKMRLCIKSKKTSRQSRYWYKKTYIFIFHNSIKSCWRLVYPKSKDISSGTKHLVLEYKAMEEAYFQYLLHVKYALLCRTSKFINLDWLLGGCSKRYHQIY